MEAERTSTGDRMISTTTDCVWSTHIFPAARILTFTVDTRFCSRTIFVAAATEDTLSTHTSLVELTLRMRDAGYYALVVNTFLSIRAIGN
jgi:hypothetical protein